MTQPKMARIVRKHGYHSISCCCNAVILGISALCWTHLPHQAGRWELYQLVGKKPVSQYTRDGQAELPAQLQLMIQ